MASEWQELSLAEAGVQLIDCDHRTPPAADFGYPYIAIPQLKDGRIELGDVRRISAEHYADWTRKLKPRAHDVIVVRRCNSGQSAFVPEDLECAIGQNLVILRSDGRKVYPEYLRWLVRGPEWWLEVQRHINVGAVFDSLRCRDIPNFRVKVPSFQEQVEIAETLGALDDRIENLRQTNATLQAIVAALFKSWFVDFDGVPPEDMQESELGLIPKGWRIGALEDLLVLQRGFDLPVQNRIEGEYPVIAAGGINGTHHKGMVKGPGVVTGRSGVLGNVFLELGDFWPLNTTLWIKEFRAAKPCFSYELLRRFDFSAFNAGSAVPTLNRNHIHCLPQLIPPAKEVEAFEDIALTLHQRVKENGQQAATLTALRDTLLPRLISGRLRLSEAARQIVEVTA